MSIEVHKFDFSLVGMTTGDSPVFGAMNTFTPPYGGSMNNWHWNVDISALPAYAWTVMFSSIIMESHGPADIWPPGFSAAPNLNYMARTWMINNDGIYPSKFEVPLNVSYTDTQVQDIDGPWRISTTGDFFNPDETATYYLTEALSGGTGGYAFQWAEPNWLCKVSMPGHANTTTLNGYNLARTGSTFCYFMDKVNTVDYWFSCGNSTRTSDGVYVIPSTWTQLDARLIVIGCPGNPLYMSIV